MTKRKVVFVLPSLNPGGAERVVSTLANEFIKYFKVVIITFDSNPSFYYLDSQIVHRSCLPDIKIKPSNNIIQSIGLNLKILRRINCILKEEEADCVIGFLTTANILSIIASKWRKIPVIVSERNNPKQETISKFWIILRKLIYPEANLLVVQSSLVKKYYEETIRNMSIVILPNPLSPELTKSKTAIKKNNVILNIGRLSSQKNQQLLIKAFSKTSNNNWTLKIVGEGELRKDLENLISSLEMTKKIKLEGKTKDIAKYYQSSKIFVLSSRYEGFPNALIEAMYFGIPCLSTNAPFGPSELIQDNKNGYLVEVGDEIGMTAKLDNLMHNETLRETFGLLSKEAIEKFEVGNVAREWMRNINLFLN